MKTSASRFRLLLQGVVLLVFSFSAGVAMSWPADLLKWATIVYEGAAKHPDTYQQALAYTFKYNKSLNRMAMIDPSKGGMPDPIYQANQRVFKKINQELCVKAARDAGLVAKLQATKPGSSEVFKSGTDTDIIVESGPSKHPITLDDIRKTESAYQRRVKDFLSKRSVEAPGKIDTDTDFMPNSKDTTPSEFKKINKYINKNGGTAYESPAAAEVEAKLRTPGAKLEVGETGSYVAEMEKLAAKKLRYADLMDYEARVIAKSQPARALELQAEAQLARSQVGKYISRIDDATRKLVSQHSIDVPEIESPFWKAVNKVNKVRGAESATEAASVGALGKYGTDKALSSYAETLAKIAANNGGKASKEIVESVSHLPPSAQVEFIENLRVNSGFEAVAVFKGEMRQLNEASRIAARNAAWKAKFGKGLKVLGAVMIVHDGYGRIKAAWNAKPEDKPQVALEEGGAFVAGTGGAFAVGAATGALAGSWFPVAGPIVGGIVGGVVGYLAGNYVGREAGRKAATLLGVNQQAHLPAILSAAQRLHNGLIRRGVPPKEALAAARAFLNGPMKDFHKIMARIRRLYGKNGGYVSVRHSQHDWYCTNRPVIKSDVKMPDLIQEETNRVNKIRSMFGLTPIQTSD